jgi:hypothetical protein
MPWRVLRKTAPGKPPPQPGNRWRVNLSRVEWQVDAKGGPLREAARSGHRQAGWRHPWLQVIPGCVAPGPESQNG